MTGRPVFDGTYAADIRILRKRGWTVDRIARHYGMSRATVYRVLDREER